MLGVLTGAKVLAALAVTGLCLHAGVRRVGHSGAGALDHTANQYGRGPDRRDDQAGGD